MKKQVHVKWWNLNKIGGLYLSIIKLINSQISERNGKFIQDNLKITTQDSVFEKNQILFQRDKRKASIYVILEKGYVQSSTHIGKKLLLFARNIYLS